MIEAIEARKELHFGSEGVALSIFSGIRESGVLVFEGSCRCKSHCCCRLVRRSLIRLNKLTLG